MIFPDSCWFSFSNWAATAFFHVGSSLLVTSHYIWWYIIVWAADSMIRHMGTKIWPGLGSSRWLILLGGCDCFVLSAVKKYSVQSLLQHNCLFVYYKQVTSFESLTIIRLVCKKLKWNVSTYIKMPSCRTDEWLYVCMHVNLHTYFLWDFISSFLC
jgi:hypothetical protein